MRNSLHKLPKAPRRFEVIDLEQDKWQGKPSTQYGVVRRLAHEQRKAQQEIYCRVLHSDAGRNGDPWGGCALEANGEIFHFSAGIKQLPEEEQTKYQAEKGELAQYGKEQLAHGVVGHLSTSKDWRWVQEEADVTSLISAPAIQDIVDHYRKMLNGDIPIPTFQAQTWAKRLGVPINPDFHNCTTIILRQLKEKAGINLHERMPFPALEAIQQLIGETRSALDVEVNFFLHKSEEELDAILRHIAAGKEMNWNDFAKHVAHCPEWLTWESFQPFVS